MRGEVGLFFITLSLQHSLHDKVFPLVIMMKQKMYVVSGFIYIDYYNGSGYGLKIIDGTLYPNPYLWDFVSPLK